MCLSKSNLHRYTEAEAKVVVRRTLEGIDYMHSKLVVHRDLKLEVGAVQVECS
jgi:serine/threonine protein kinase